MAERPADHRLREALALLAAVARERLPAALPRGAAEVELRLKLPLAGHAAIDAAAGELERELREELQALADASALVQPGHVWCPRDASSSCEHSAPPDARHVLAGYGPTGLPRWLDFGQLLLEKQHPRVAELYEERSRPVTLVQGWNDVGGELLPTFRERFGRLRLHGQVSAGWYRAPATAPAGERGGAQDAAAAAAGRSRGNGHGDGWQRMAICFQLLSSGRGPRRRYALHAVGAAASGPVLDALHHHHERLPWRDAVRWAEGALQQIETAARRPHAPPPQLVERRLAGLLQHLAERIERPFRARERRTAHGEERHQGGRPTHAAIADLREAALERVLFDARHDTFVVLGPRGRTHVFGTGGKLVTSVRYPAATIEKRQKTGAWRAVTAQQAAGLLASVEALVSGAAE